MNFDYADAAPMLAPDQRIGLMQKYVEMEREMNNAHAQAEDYARKRDTLAKELSALRYEIGRSIGYDQADAPCESESRAYNGVRA